MVWYSHVFQNFTQFTVTHTVKGFGIVNKAEIVVFLELSCSFDDPVDVGNLIRSEEHTSELQSHIGISDAVFCLKKFFFNDTATTEIYTLSLHDALPIFGIINKAEIDVFLELSCFFNGPADVGNLISGSSVPAPLAGRGSTTARGILRVCPASACQTGLPWSSPPA